MPVAGTFSSATFTPPFRYTTSQGGWANWKDLRGWYALMPPGEAPQGMDEGTSEFIGVYRGAAAAPADCTDVAEDPQPSAGSMAAAIAAHPGLTVVGPEPISIGGLSGVMMDLSIAPDWHGACPWEPDLPVVPLIVGSGVSSFLHHGLDASYDTRLYLLDSDEGVVTIEAVDLEGRLDLDGFDEVVRSFTFDLDAPSPGPECPNSEGGACLGELEAGTYETVKFDPQLTYAVAEGWQNFEDTPGNFLLVPPGFDLLGVNSGASDFIGVYSTIVAASLECSVPELAERPQPGVGTSPEEIAAEFQARPGLIVSNPETTSIRGRDGLVLDIEFDPTWTEPCFYSQGNPVVPLIQGTGISGLDHPMGPGLTMRLYLLENGSGTLLVEVSQSGEGDRLDVYSDVVSEFQFGS
jgi:hypothetical protein